METPAYLCLKNLYIFFYKTKAVSLRFYLTVLIQPIIIGSNMAYYIEILKYHNRIDVLVNRLHFLTAAP